MKNSLTHAQITTCLLELQPYRGQRRLVERDYAATPAQLTELERLGYITRSHDDEDRIQFTPLAYAFLRGK